MRVQQGRVSESVNTFKYEYLRKFNLVDAFDVYRPVVFFGIYTDEDYLALKRFKDKKIIVWCGTDSLMIDSDKANRLKKIKAEHIVKSKFMSDDLKKWDIPHRILPVSWQDYNIKPMPLGNYIFYYGNGDFYGEQYLNKIEKRTGLKIIKTTKDTYTKEELMKVYKKCFVALRLTLHDGLPNTVLEMGMMGRRSIYNGEVPTCLGWSDIDSIVRGIEKAREADTNEVSRRIKEYINIGDNWLNV